MYVQNVFFYDYFNKKPVKIRHSISESIESMVMG